MKFNRKLLTFRESNSALPSILQKIRESDTLFSIVTCGSRIAFMSELLAQRNPLWTNGQCYFSFHRCARNVAQWILLAATKHIFLPQNFSTPSRATRKSISVRVRTGSRVVAGHSR